LLSLKHCKLDDAFAQPLADGLAFNTSLKVLNLAENQFDDRAAVMVATSLSMKGVGL